MALSTRIQRQLTQRGDRIVVNPKSSVLSRNVGLDIRMHHLFRSLQVLNARQSQGAFTKDDFDVFVGRGAVNAIGDTTGRKMPPATRRRSITSLTPDAIERWLPFPGRIYFTSGQTSDLVDAVKEFLALFARHAPRGAGHKTHSYRYAQSLALFIEGIRMDPAGAVARLDKLSGEALTGVGVEVINYAPHAATLELAASRAAGMGMFLIARQLNSKYAPGIQVGYDYVSSDTIGLTYAKGEGGPSPETAKRTSRQYPVVYALPRVTFLVPGPGRSNLKFRRPGMKLSRAARRRLATRGEV